MSKETLREFLQNQKQIITEEELKAFFRAVDLDLDGRVSYSELVEAVHLMEPLPYKSSGVGLRESEIMSAV